MEVSRTPYVINIDETDLALLLKRVKSTDVPFTSIIRLLRVLKLDLDNGCWFRREDWSNYTTVGKIQAHRLSYWVFTGIKPPENREVCHNCDRKGCINPDHLFVGTHGDNMRDAMNKGWNRRRFY